MGKIEDIFKCLFGDSFDDKLKSIPDPELKDDFYYDEKTGLWLPKSKYTSDKLQSLIDRLFKGVSPESKVKYTGEITDISE